MSTPSWQGHRLREHREAAGLTQTELATAIGKHKDQVSQWERGIRTPSAESLVRLSGALGVSVDHLLGLGGPRGS